LSKRKQEKNTYDCWDSISIVRIGNTAGSSRSPWIFLASGKRIVAMWTNKQLQDMLRYFTDPAPQPVNVMKLDKEGLRNAVSRASVCVCTEERATINPIASV